MSLKISEADRESWYSAVGMFLLHFGAVDYLLFEFLYRNLPAEEFSGVRKKHFKDRMSRMAEYMTEAGFPAEDQQRLATFMEQMEPIREMRNHLAHGHLAAFSDPCDANGFPGAETRPESIVFNPRDFRREYLAGSRKVKFAELQEGLKRLHELTQLLWSISKFGR